MSKINYKKSLAIGVSFLIFLPLLFVFAQPAGSPLPTIKNPLGDGNNDVNSILLKIMNIVAMVGGIVVVFFIIFSGFKLVTAGSNEGNRTKAKEMFSATIIGGSILLGADIIANVVVGTIKAIK
jgi:hypothetical protein